MYKMDSKLQRTYTKWVLLYIDETLILLVVLIRGKEKNLLTRLSQSMKNKSRREWEVAYITIVIQAINERVNSNK